MTKVQIEYELFRPLSGADAAGVAAVRACYGIMRVKLAPGLERLTVDYDASRLTRGDVDAVLLRHGVAIRRNDFPSVR